MFKNLIPKKYIWFIIVRFISFFVIGMTTFFGPKIIGLEEYGKIEYELQMIGLSTIFLLGIHSGYGYQYYSKLKPSLSSFLSFGGIQALLISIFLSIIMHQDIYSYGILFFLLSVLLEQIYKINNHFNIAILFKPIASVLLFAYYYIISIIEPENIYSRQAINAIYFIAFIVFAIIYLKHHVLHDKKINFSNFLKNVKYGFEPNLTTSLIILFFFVDRYFINKYFEDNLGVYSIAYNFSYLTFLFASSIGYVTTVKIGEKLQDPNALKLYMGKLYKIGFTLLIGSFIVMIPLIIFVSKYWFTEDNFTTTAILNLISKTLFGASSIFAPIIFYKKMERYQWVFLLLLTILLIIINSSLVNLVDVNFLQIQYTSNILLSIYSIYVYFLSLRIIKKKIINTK